MGKAKILIVDDEPDVVHLLQRSLEAEQYEVMCAYDGIGAVDMASDEQPDLILLDIMMPMMSGYEVCEQLKANPATSQIPVVCVSSAHGPEVRARSKEAGANTILLKPFTTAELVAQIQRYLPETAES